MTFSSSSKFAPWWHLAMWGFVGMSLVAACGDNDSAASETINLPAPDIRINPHS